jgi:4-oxalocrotonate tautomerase
MPMITVQMFPGRTQEQKAELVQRLTDAFIETCGRPGQTAEGVWVVIDEVPREHWAIGGKLGTPPPAGS